VSSLLKQHLNPLGLSHRSRNLILLLVLCCQLLGAWVPRGMMPGLAGSDASLLVFCGAQSNPALLKLIPEELRQKLAAADPQHDPSSVDPGSCPFGALSVLALPVDDSGAALPLPPQHSLLGALPILSDHRASPYLLGPQNKAPPFFLFV
jgi:hypothetical protein